MCYVFAAVIVMVFFSFSNCLAIDYPLSAIEKEYVAIGHEEEKSGANTLVKSDGSLPRIHVTDSGSQVYPEVGDRVGVEYVQGWKLTFWNIGESGGENSKTAKLEGFLKYLSAGQILKDVNYTENAAGAREYSGWKSEPANPNDILPPYYVPEQVYTLGYTGGPNGVFYELGGVKQHSSGEPIRGEVQKDESTGLYYVQFSGAINVRLDISDPDVFKGFEKLAENRDLSIEEEYAYAFTDLSGEVIVEYEDGEEDFGADFYIGSNEKNRKVIPPGSTIKTGKDSYVVVNFGDSADFVLGPNSTLKIKKPEHGFFDTQKGQVLINIKKNIAQMIKEGSLDVTMNQAVAGRKGTTAVFIEEDGISTVKVLEGEISFKSISTGEVKSVLPGETISANKEGLSQLTKFSVEGELEQWEKAVPAEAIDKIREYVNQETKTLDNESKSSVFTVLPFVAVITLFIIVFLYKVLSKKSSVNK